jgi:hypothetical protein
MGNEAGAAKSLESTCFIQLQFASTPKIKEYPIKKEVASRKF